MRYKQYISKVYRKEVVLFLVYLIPFLYFLKYGIVTWPDSSDYISMGITRPPVYPIFLLLQRSIFGTLGFYSAICLQLILAAMSVYILSMFLKNTFRLNWMWTFIVSCVLSLPYFIRYSEVGGILSEALAYPLFLIAFRYFADAAINKSCRALLAYLSIYLILVLTRGQFLFLIPSTVILIIFLLISNHNIRTKFKKILLSILVVFFLPSLVTSTYNYIVNGYFVTNPYVGIQIATNAFYVSKAEDAQFFKKQDEKELFQTIFKDIDSKKLTAYYGSTPEHQMKTYNYICWHNIVPTMEKYATAKGANNYQERWILIDRTTLSMSATLVKENFTKFLQVYLENCRNGTLMLLKKALSLLRPDFKSLIISDLILSFVIILSAALGILFLKKRKTNYALLYFFVLSLLTCNVALIGLVEPVLFRYTIYTDFPFYAILLISLSAGVDIFLKGEKYTPQEHE